MATGASSPASDTSHMATGAPSPMSDTSSFEDLEGHEIAARRAARAATEQGSQGESEQTAADDRLEELIIASANVDPIVLSDDDDDETEATRKNIACYNNPNLGHGDVHPCFLL